jgi:RimJ/RimL family protein N-acetyltransferase
MTQAWVQARSFVHGAVGLVPLTVGHSASLARAAGGQETFRYFSRGPETIDEAGMRAFIARLLGPAETVPFCVMDPGTGEPIGITTYLDIRPAHKGLEIGWTWYGPAARGTKVNPACKYLLLRHAFEELGAIRVCLKTDERNARSRAAILKLGASFEGILRENIIMQDGFRRSTAMYSILAPEWPGVKRGLEVRLDG